MGLIFGKMAWPFSKRTGGTSSLVSICLHICPQTSILVDLTRFHCSKFLKVGIDVEELDLDSEETGLDFSGSLAYPTDNRYSM